MMELQTLQEALKVEIQVHQKLVAQMKQDPQNADLKKQLHELQAKITALSEKQKKVVEQLRKDLLVKQEPELKLQLQTTQTADTKHLLQLSAAPAQQPTVHQNTGVQQKTLTVTPVLTTKTLPLVLKAATATMPGSAAGQCPTVAMVTAISNMPKSVVSSDSQATPINLQVASKLTNQGSEPVRIISKNAIVVQAATTTSAQPIRVPQFVPPARAAPRPAYLPQVRPKPPAPNNVPIAPAPATAPPPPMVAAPSQLLQRPIMLATKVSSASLPQTTPIHQVRIVNGQPCATLAKSSPTGQVTGIVISAPAPALQISNLPTEAKTVKSPGGPEPVPVPVRTPPSSSPPPPPPVAKPKREENPQKLAFMVSLGLVTHDHLEEIQSRRQERKRRTTANPVYSGAVFEPERKKSAVTYLNTPLHQGTRKRGRPPKYSSAPDQSAHHPPRSPSGCHPSSVAPERLDAGGPPFPAHPHPLPPPSLSPGDGDIHEDFCAVCRRSGQLLMCDTCSRVYHLPCLDPPLKNIPKGMWICPKCQDQILKKEDAIPWPGTLAIVHSYIAYKEAKEEEKQKLLKWSTELKLEREQLEQRVKHLTNSITKCMETKNAILARQKEMQASLEKVKHLISLIQNFQRNQAPPEPDASQSVMKESAEQLPEADIAVPSEVTTKVTTEVTATVTAEVTMEIGAEDPAGVVAGPVSRAELSSEVEPECKVQPGPIVGPSADGEPASEKTAGSEGKLGSKVEPGSEAGDGSAGEASSGIEASSGSGLEDFTEAPGTMEASANGDAEPMEVSANGDTEPLEVSANGDSEPMEVSANGDSDTHIESVVNSCPHAAQPEAVPAPLPSNGTVDVEGHGPATEEPHRSQEQDGSRESVQPPPHNQAESPE